MSKQSSDMPELDERPSKQNKKKLKGKGKWSIWSRSLAFGVGTWYRMRRYSSKEKAEKAAAMLRERDLRSYWGKVAIIEYEVRKEK